MPRNRNRQRNRRRGNGGGGLSTVNSTVTLDAMIAMGSTRNVSFSKAVNVGAQISNLASVLAGVQEWRVLSVAATHMSVGGSAAAGVIAGVITPRTWPQSSTLTQVISSGGRLHPMSRPEKQLVVVPHTNQWVLANDAELRLDVAGDGLTIGSDVGYVNLRVRFQTRGLRST